MLAGGIAGWIRDAGGIWVPAEVPTGHPALFRASLNSRDSGVYDGEYPSLAGRSQTRGLKKYPDPGTTLTINQA